MKTAFIYYGYIFSILPIDRKMFSYKSIKKYFILITVISGLSCLTFGEVVWSDEFNGNTINKNIWTYDVGGHGFGNGQLEHDTARSKNSYIENGSLVIEAIREDYGGNSFTSARILTQGRFAFKYGILEARIKMPDTGDGLWPAFWLLGNNFPGISWPGAGEMDIVEMGSVAGISESLQQEKINCAIHYSLANGDYAYNASWIDATVDLSLDYHLYKIEWSPTFVKFFLDGASFGSWDITPSYLTEYHQPFFPIINLAIGGWDGSYTGVTTPAAVTAPFPAKMYIDWIRLEDNAFTEIYLGDDNKETGNFGVYTETTLVNNSLAFGDDTDPEFEYGSEAALYVWNNMTEVPPVSVSEGTECWSFDVAAGNWFGLGVFLPNFRNMTNYSDGFLHFDINTTITDALRVGVKSSRGGEFFLPVGNETTEFGFARDGQWHSVTIPLNRFANTDFKTIHQFFMIVGDPVSATSILSIDNVYWEPSVTRPVPANGNFGVYSETPLHKDAGEFLLGGVDGDFFVWDDTLLPLTEVPFEGSDSLSFGSTPGLNWFGAAFTPNVKHNLTAFSYPTSKLQFSLKSTASTIFQIGMKSGNVDGIGQNWITFAPGSDPYGFVRDGNWHLIEIPMPEMALDVDLFEVSQLFQILGTTGPISNIEIDDIYFSGGGDPLNPNNGGNILPSVNITSPTTGTFFDPGNNITILANAIDNDGNGTVTKVEFFEGTTLLGEDLTPPYSFTVNAVSEGTYVFRAKATDPNDGTQTSSPVSVYVGTPVLTTINVSPASVNTQAWASSSFNATGFDQFGQMVAINPIWSVSDGGVIDENGLFTAVEPGGPYTVSAIALHILDTAIVNVASSNLCSGPSGNGDYTWKASGDQTDPTITFIPARAGVGNTLVIFYYSSNPNTVFPGYLTASNTPFEITASAGETIYFYYTYNIPEGGEQNTAGNKHNFEVGDCDVLPPNDCDGNGFINIVDYGCFSQYWMETNCDSGNSNCQGRDYNVDGDVGVYDLMIFMYNWLN